MAGKQLNAALHANYLHWLRQPGDGGRDPVHFVVMHHVSRRRAPEPHDQRCNGAR